MSFSLTFGIRDDRMNKQGEAALFLRYTIKRDWVNIPLKRTIDPKFWSKEAGQPKKSYPLFDDLRKVMFEFESGYTSYIQRYYNDNGVFPFIRD